MNRYAVQVLNADNKMVSLHSSSDPSSARYMVRLFCEYPQGFTVRVKGSDREATFRHDNWRSSEIIID